MIESPVRRITWRTADVARVLMLGMAALFLWKFFWMVYSALFLGLIAVLIAIILHAPARILSRWMPFRLSFAISVVVFLTMVAGLLVRLIPQLLTQMSQVAAQLPAAMAYVGAWIEERTGAATSPELAAEVNAQLADFVGRFVPLAFNLISLFVGSFAIIILAIFLIIVMNRRDVLGEHVNTVTANVLGGLVVAGVGILGVLQIFGIV